MRTRSLNRSTPPQQVLDGLEDVRRCGDGWSARCPAHDDQNPSLSLGVGEKGQVLLHCHAGCTTKDILAALGMTFADLFEPSDDKPVVDAGAFADGKLEATYSYVDEQGRPLFEVRRYSNKGFSQHRPDGRPGIKGIRRVLYRLDRIQGRKIICIAEGEKDVDNLWTAGIPATCNSGGAEKWTDDHTKQLVDAKVQEVVVLPDNDQAGSLHAKQVARSCHAAGLTVKVVNLPDLPEKGDVSDFLAAGHTKHELAALVNATPEYTPKDEPETSTSKYGLVIRPGHDVNIERMQWLWPGRIACGVPTLFVGDPDLGKGLTLCDIVARVTTGREWPDAPNLLGPRHVIILSAEDPVDIILKPRLEAAGADHRLWAVVEAVETDDGDRGLTLETDVAKLHEMALDYKTVLLIVDPLNAYLGTTDTFVDNKVRVSLKPLVRMT